MADKKKFIKYLVVLILFLALLPAKTAFAAVDSSRLAGADRYETAIRISQRGWKAQSAYVILAGAEGSPDTLCSVPLAKKYNAPILITERDSLRQDVREEILRLKVKEVFIVGGYGNISQSVEDEILSMDIKATRIKGADRYETSVRIAEHLGNSGQIVLAGGNDFPGILSIASIAANKGMPILLSKRDSLPAVVRDYLKGRKITKTYVIGGKDIISEDLYSTFYSLKPERLGGENEYETNTIILNRFKDQLNFVHTYIAASTNYFDAMTGSTLAFKSSSPIILVDKDPPQATQDFVKGKLPSMNQVTVLGGKGALPEDVLKAMLSGFKRSEPTYTLINKAQYDYIGLVAITNGGNADISDIKLQINLGEPSTSPYQNSESFQASGEGISIIDGDNGGKKAVVSLKVLKKGESVNYRILRTYTNGGIKYNADLSKASRDYGGFKSFEKYTSAEDKIESSNPLIKAKVEEITKDIKSPYLKAKSIFEFVNTSMNYDFSEGGKGALNAFITGKGVSEDFARLFVAMARCAKIPSRVVYGYRVESIDLASAEDLETYEYAWAEFYLPGYGWIVVEPTEMKSDFNNNRVPAYEYFANLSQPGHFIQSYKSEPSYAITYYGGESTEPGITVDIKEYIMKK